MFLAYVEHCLVLTLKRNDIAVRGSGTCRGTANATNVLPIVREAQRSEPRQPRPIADVNARATCGPAKRTRMNLAKIAQSAPPKGSGDVTLLDVRITNDPADVVILLPKKSGRISTAHLDRMKLLGNESRLDFRRLHRRSEQAGELGNRFFWRSCWREQPESNLRLEVLIARFSDSRHLGQRVDPRP
jgi:hypothetical protein